MLVNDACQGNKKTLALKGLLCMMKGPKWCMMENNDQQTDLVTSRS